MILFYTKRCNLFDITPNGVIIYYNLIDFKGDLLMKKEKEQNRNKEISAENLAKAIFESLREAIVAVCTQEENKVNVRFPSGKTLLVSVKER